MRRIMGTLAFALAFTGAAAAAQAAPPIQCERVADGTISVDGLRGDWKDVTPLEIGGGYAKDGDKGRWDGNPDLLARLRCAHDAKGTYLLLEVDDDQVVRTGRFSTKEDRVELLFADERGKLRELQIHPPNAKFRTGRVRWTKAPFATKKLKYSVIRLPQGYAIELWIQAGGVPGYGVGSPSLPMTLRIVDHDGGPTAKPDTILVTGGETPTTLGKIEYDTAKKLFDQFLKEKGLTKQNVLHHEVGNFITGEAMEQLVIAGTWLAFIGEDVMKGGAYYALPIPMAKSQQNVLRFRTLDLDGNGNKDVVIIVREEGTHGLSRDLMVILRFLDSGKPDLYFASEVAVRRGDQMELTNKYDFKRVGKKYELILSVDQVKGWTKENHQATGGGRIESLCTPWGKKRKIFTFAADGYHDK